jgi:putative endonuclease
MNSRGGEREDMTKENNCSNNRSGNINKGKYGEELAAGFLQNQGYQIIFRNFYSKYGELDIVAKKSNLLVFVEVKTRTQDRFGIPAEAVNARKRKHMEYAAKYFVQRYGFHHVDIRFDVIEVSLNHLESI